MAPTGRHNALSTGPAPDLDRRRDPRQEHITEDEFPRDCQVCALAPVEEPIAGETLD
ncbi:MAG: hypothetical protein ACRDTE_17970 [Pseudonocardiaceae bacterium]